MAYDSNKPRFAVLYADEGIGTEEITGSLRDLKLMPIMVLRSKKDPEAPPKVPCFYESKHSEACSRRNVPKDWQHGTIILTDRDFVWIKSKKWELYPLKFPHHFTKHPEYSISFEMMEFEERPSAWY